MVSVKQDDRADADLEAIDFSIAQKVVAKVTWLAENYADIAPELLQYGLKGVYKLRIGDYRVLYKVEGEVIIIKMIDHRSRVYNRISRIAW